MNCEQCQELISDLLDGALSPKDTSLLDSHFEECLACTGVREDLESVLSFCQANRGVYDAPPNERALWLRVRNSLEASEVRRAANSNQIQRKNSWKDFFSHTWQLSFPQLAASVAALVLIVALVTVVGLRRIDSNNAVAVTNNVLNAGGYKLNERMSQQQQTISYWNTRITTNRARWSSQMRDTFDHNLNVIDLAVNDSLNELNKNPHDEVSEEMLNAALNEKIALLKEFSELE